MEPLDLVKKYLNHLNSLEYNEAGECLEDSVKVVGPAREGFHDKAEFVKMLEKYRSRYDFKKYFANGSDVCVLYDFVFDSTRVYASSWYQVANGKIHTITTVFDPAKMP